MGANYLSACVCGYVRVDHCSFRTVVTRQFPDVTQINALVGRIEDSILYTLFPLACTIENLREQIV